MTAILFDNRFVDQLPGDPDSDGPRQRQPRQVPGAAWSAVQPTPVPAPRLLAHSADLAETLGLAPEFVASQPFADLFAGNRLLDDMQPFAANYGGHQFGTWAGQLGDGRAITLGELSTADGRHWQLQLKGAGRTPYSRGADGRAVLRSSVREFLCSEAMHHLGVPTTRALSLVATGQAVTRDMFYDGHPRDEPGAIVCRVAPSFVRFGSFELPAARGERALLEQLVDYTIARDFPHLSGDDATRRSEWFAEVCERTARLVADWMRVGFVHGVLNTDNMSILGLTIDYGPYGWIDDYDPDFTPNTSDAQGRYRFGWQPRIAYWNLSRLAGALAPLFADTAPLEAGLQRFGTAFALADRSNAAAKLGLADCRDDDVARMRALLALLHEGEVDMTLFFRGLLDLDAAAPSLEPFAEAFYDAGRRAQIEARLEDWLRDYAARLGEDPLSAEQRRERLRRANPKFVLRNYLSQQAIERAEAGDCDGIAELLEVMRVPYDEPPGCERFAAKRPDWARTKAGCSMLSCSS